MPSSLPQSTFDLLGVFNGGWPGPVIANQSGNQFSNEIAISGLLGGLVINGNGGNDRITVVGNSLVGTINGGEGSDQIFGGPGIDVLNGGNGNDYIVGGRGSNSLNGNAGLDTVGYENATGGVTVNLVLGGTGAGTGPSIIDVLTGFENVVGSNFADTITGDAGNNILIGPMATILYCDTQNG